MGAFKEGGHKVFLLGCGVSAGFCSPYHDMPLLPQRHAVWLSGWRLYASGTHHHRPAANKGEGLGNTAAECYIKQICTGRICCQLQSCANCVKIKLGGVVAVCLVCICRAMPSLRMLPPRRCRLSSGSSSCLNSTRWNHHRWQVRCCGDIESTWAHACLLESVVRDNQTQ